MKYEPDIERQLNLATLSAQRSLDLDPLDPFANFNMARTHWLTDGLENSRNWLDRTLQLSPNSAQGHYARGWVDTMMGESSVAREYTSVAMSLSPLDPMYFAMLATTALSHLAEGNNAQAVILADRAARSPGAHYLISVIAAVAHAQNGNMYEAGFWVRDVRSKRQDINKEMFFASFPFKHPGTRELLDKTLSQLGF